MELDRLLPLLLGTAWLAPLASFALLVFLGPRLGKHGKGAGYVATGAIALGFVLSAIALGLWVWHHPVPAAGHGEPGAAHAHPTSAIWGDWYSLGEFGSLRITVGYYIDALTVAMFAMVTLVATCIHVYSFGYMHEELHEVTDPQVLLADGTPLRRPGRFPRFFQYLSLFCFSMLGLVIAGNVAMVFVFWELVGICSYLLIGFYRERKSASNAANKAFIVNRVGDFGMIVGLMALWGGLGTFAFGDSSDGKGPPRPGIFSQVRPAAAGHELTVPDGMVRLAARDQIAAIYRATPDRAAAEARIASQIPAWRAQGLGYWLLVIAGLGVFCGCVGKSAQFPLHVWLPDAMEGPTPVSALIHAATMVAAGVYLVGRFYPVFTPEVLLVIACVGCTTLFLAATMALVATDIKRVLAYSTVSQLGYMMFALGVGGWLAGLFHLFTHAFFKALLFLGSGSVIHATGTNEMPKMGGLLKKMPWTASTMLVGCLAIAGAGIPFVIGLSGYYSKDAILAQAFSFRQTNPAFGWMFVVAAGGAALTAYYMFRLWFMTFAGHPRDHHLYEHAHESPKVMYLPLVVLAVFAVALGWPVFRFTGLVEQARPAGTVEGAAGGALLPAVAMPAEHLSHDAAIHTPVTWFAFGAALAGFAIAVVFYGARLLRPDTVRRVFRPIYWLLWNKWWFDQLYHLVLVRPALALARAVAAVDRQAIDWVADGMARAVRIGSSIDDWIDRLFVDGLVNRIAGWTYRVGLWLRAFQTGRLRQYVLFVGVGTVGLFVLISFLRAVAFGSL
jgi:NADH-quinone oxidoreductase subunit L